MIKGFPSRKDNIILAAIDIIDEKGVQGLSTKEIALKQEISESILYKHFKSLDEVMVAVLDYFSQYDDMLINTIDKKGISYKEKLLESIKSLVELYESYPALASVILNYEVFMNYSHTREKTIEIIKKRLSFIEKIIKMGQETKELEEYYTSNELANIIMGTFRNSLLNWKINGYDYSVKTEVLNLIIKILARS